MDIPSAAKDDAERDMQYDRYGRPRKNFGRNKPNHKYSDINLKLPKQVSFPKNSKRHDYGDVRVRDVYVLRRYRDEAGRHGQSINPTACVLSFAEMIRIYGRYRYPHIRLLMF